MILWPRCVQDLAQATDRSSPRSGAIPPGDERKAKAEAQRTGSRKMSQTFVNLLSNYVIIRGYVLLSIVA